MLLLLGLVFEVFFGEDFHDGGSGESGGGGGVRSDAGGGKCRG